MPKKWVGSREEAATTSLINGSVRLLLATRVEEAGDNGGAATHASQKDCVGMKTCPEPIRKSGERPSGSFG